MVADDQGIPPKTATAVVQLTVTRDEYAPEFVGTQPFEAAPVNENKRVGDRVYQLSARDRDLKV